jgi:hypothetical protein
MPRYNPEEYDMVENRIARFLDDYPDGRIITREMTSEEDRRKSYWVVMAEIFIDHEDQHARCPKASGWAFEIEGTSGANATAALENCETSAIGRALANAGYSGNKRASRSEMRKVTRKDNPIPDEFVNQINQAENVDKLTELWAEATEAGWAEDLQKLFSARKQVIGKING